MDTNKVLRPFPNMSQSKPYIQVCWYVICGHGHTLLVFCVFRRNAWRQLCCSHVVLDIFEFKKTLKRERHTHRMREVYTSSAVYLNHKLIQGTPQRKEDRKLILKVGFHSHFLYDLISHRSQFIQNAYVIMSSAFLAEVWAWEFKYLGKNMHY